jgi:hypothetical protein
LHHVIPIRISQKMGVNNEAVGLGGLWIPLVQLLLLFTGLFSMYSSTMLGKRLWGCHVAPYVFVSGFSGIVGNGEHVADWACELVLPALVHFSCVHFFVSILYLPFLSDKPRSLHIWDGDSCYRYDHCTPQGYTSGCTARDYLLFSPLANPLLIAMKAQGLGWLATLLVQIVTWGVFSTGPLFTYYFFKQYGRRSLVPWAGPHTHTCTHAHMHTCTHIHAYTYTRMHAYTLSPHRRVVLGGSVCNADHLRAGGSSRGHDGAPCSLFVGFVQLSLPLVPLIVLFAPLRLTHAPIPLPLS